MTRGQRIALVLLLGLAALVRVGLVLSLEGKPYFYDPVVDSAAYDRWGQEIARGQVLGRGAYYQDPLYPYWLGAIYAAFGRDLYLVRLLQLALGVLGCWLLFETARRLADLRVAFVALVLAALYKPFVFYDTALLKEFLAVVLVEAALLFVVLDKRWSWSAAGVALGLACLVRANLMLVIAALTIFFLIRRKPRALLLAGGAILAILPVTIRNAVVAKDFVLTTYQLGPNLYIGNHAGNRTGRYVPPPFLTAASPDFEEQDFRAEAERMQRRPLKPSEISAYWWDRTWVETSSDRFVGLSARRLAEYANAYEVPDNYNYYFMERFSWILKLPLPGFWLVAPLAAAGMIFAWRKWGWMYVFAGIYLLSVIPFFVFGRYRLPLMPVLILFAAMGAVGFAERKRPWAPAVVALVVLVQCAIPIGARSFDAAHYNLGLHYYQTGRPAKAAAELERVRHIKNPPWTYLRGLAYEESGRPEKALEAFFEIAAQSPDAAFHLARAYRDVDNADEAIRWYVDTVGRDPGRLDAWAELGRLYRAKKDWLGALRCADKIAMTSWEGNLERARIYADVGMWPQVVQECDEVLRRAKNHKEARELRERALRQ
jgi:4-amino-4-deoxy-L-arabinose transferase-like glycosyltransferase